MHGRELIPGVAVACLVFTVAGCGLPGGIVSVPVDVSRLKPDVRMELSMALQADNLSFLSRGVIHKEGNRLDAWVLTPTGVRLAHYWHQGAEVGCDVRVNGFPALGPEVVLRDVRRVFFQGCGNPKGLERRSCLLHGARFVERYGKGHGDLLERTVEREGVTWRMTCSEHEGEGLFRYPRKVHITDDRLGYSLDIVVNSFERLVSS